MNAPSRRKLLEKRELSMPRTLEPYQMIERSIIKKYRDELWKPFVYAVKKYELIQAGDKIAVCISGGKDLMLMAKLMQELHRHSDVPFELVFLVMDQATTPSTASASRATRRCCTSPSRYSRPISSRWPTARTNRPATSAPACGAATFTARPRSSAATRSRWDTTSTMSSRRPS